MRTEKAAQLSRVERNEIFFGASQENIFHIFFHCFYWDGRQMSNGIFDVHSNFFRRDFFVKNIITTQRAALHANISFVMGQLQIFFRIFFFAP